MSFDNGSNGEVLAIDNATEMENLSFPQRTTRSLCSRGFYWPIHSPLILFLLFILAANGIEIILMMWKEALRTVSNMFLVSLAVSDLLFGLIGIPLFLVCSIKIRILVCMFSVLVIQFTAISSVFHLFAIACDRYAMIVHSMTYQERFTKARASVLIAFIWSLAFVSSFIELTWYKASTDFKELINQVYLLFVLIVFLLVPLLSMLFMYGHILVISFRHIFAVRRRQRNLGQRLPPIVHDMRGTFILATMMLIFISCWLPFFLQVLQDCISEKFFIVNPEWGACVILYLRFIPPLTNPILCAFCKRDFRRAWQSLARQPWWPIHGDFYSIPAVSGTRHKTVSTGNDATYTERPNCAQNSTDSLNGIVSVHQMQEVCCRNQQP